MNKAGHTLLKVRLVVDSISTRETAPESSGQQMTFLSPLGAGTEESLPKFNRIYGQLNVLFIASVIN